MDTSKIVGEKIKALREDKSISRSNELKITSIYRLLHR